MQKFAECPFKDICFPSLWRILSECADVCKMFANAVACKCESQPLSNTISIAPPGAETEGGDQTVLGLVFKVLTLTFSLIFRSTYSCVYTRGLHELDFITKQTTRYLVVSNTRSIITRG